MTNPTIAIQASRLENLASHVHDAQVRRELRSVAAELRKVGEPVALIQTMRDALDTCNPGDWSTGHVIYPSYSEESVAEAIRLADEYLARKVLPPLPTINPTHAG